ncbi:hypothetical protein ACERNI_12180 [Camelimonas sp. ID_303_24]
MRRFAICLAMLAGFGLGVMAMGPQAQAAVTGPQAAVAAGAEPGGLFERAYTVCGPYGCVYRPGPRYYAPRPYYRPYYAPRRYYYRPRYYAPRPYYRRYYGPRYYRRW